jgi:hypothetical protein
MPTQDKPIKAAAAAANAAAFAAVGGLAQRTAAAAGAAQQAAGKAPPSFVFTADVLQPLQQCWASKVDRGPAAEAVPAAPDAAAGAGVKIEAQQAAVAADAAQQAAGKAPPSFVFTADVLRPLQQCGAAKDSSGPASEANSPEAMVGVEDPFHRLRSSSEPDEAAAADADAARGQQPSSAANRSREGSALFSLPKREWQKLSATAGMRALTKKQQQQKDKQLAKAAASDVHMARAVQAFRGVFAVEGTALYEVRMYRNKLGKGKHRLLLPQVLARAQLAAVYAIQDVQTGGGKVLSASCVC